MDSHPKNNISYTFDQGYLSTGKMKNSIFLLIFRIKQTGVDPKNNNENESNEVL